MPSKKTKSKPEAIRRRLDQLVRCNCAEAGTCDNPDYFADCAGFPSICPHSVPHKPIRGCDDDDAVCPFFAPLAGPCKCVPVDSPNPEGLRTRHLVAGTQHPLVVAPNLAEKKIEKGC